MIDYEIKLKSCTCEIRHQDGAGEILAVIKADSLDSAASFWARRQGGKAVRVTGVTGMSGCFRVGRRAGDALSLDEQFHVRLLEENTG